MDLSLDKLALQDALKKDLSPEDHKWVVSCSQERDLSERRACRLAGAVRRVVRYQSVKSEDTALGQRMKELADRYRRSGIRFCMLCSGERALRLITQRRTACMLNSGAQA